MMAGLDLACSEQKQLVPLNLLEQDFTVHFYETTINLYFQMKKRKHLKKII